MNSNSITPNSHLDSSILTEKTTKETSLPNRQFLKNWLLVPLIATPLILVVSDYFSGLQARQSSAPVASGVAETFSTTASLSLELELAKTQRDAFEKKYLGTLAQLEGTQDLHADLQTVYQDLSDRMESVKRQNQQLQAVAIERAPLLAQVKQLQQTKEKFGNQVHKQEQQLTALQNRLDAIENQKQKLTEENQQLKLAASKLEALKLELEQANRTIEQLSSQLDKKPNEMATINVNGKQFLVTKQLAEALKTEQQKLKVVDNLPAAEQKHQHH